MKRKITCRDKDNNKIIVPVEQLQFRPSVYGIVFNEDKTKILLSKQWDGYDYPGGGVKKGERLLEALEREVYEEVGIQINGAQLIECTDDFYLARGEKYLHSILIYFVVDNFAGEPNIKNIDETEVDYISGFEWVSVDKIGKIKFYNSVDNVRIVEKALNLN